MAGEPQVEESRERSCFGDLQSQGRRRHETVGDLCGAVAVLYGRVISQIDLCSGTCRRITSLAWHHSKTSKLEFCSRMHAAVVSCSTSCCGQYPPSSRFVSLWLCAPDKRRELIRLPLTLGFTPPPPPPLCPHLDSRGLAFLAVVVVVVAPLTRIPISHLVSLSLISHTST